MSRHYYDIVMLAGKGIALKALKKRELLEEVVKNSRIDCTDSNYSNSYKAFKDLLERKIRLVPPVTDIAALQRDYAGMLDSGMFFGDHPSFEEIMVEIGELENKLNNT
jgi:hypothetical protein